MFYSHEVLTSRKYGVATVWLVATLGSKSSLKKVNRSDIVKVNVPKACETIIRPEAPMALRLQSNLLYGVSRVYLQQCGYVLTDVQSMQLQMRRIEADIKAITHDVEVGRAARSDQLILPDDPNFLPDLGYAGLELDLSNLDVTTDASSQSSGVSSVRRAQSSQSSVHGAPEIIVPSVDSSGVEGFGFDVGDNDDLRSGRLSSLARSAAHYMNEGDEGGFLPDPGFAFDGDGNMYDIPSEPVPQTPKGIGSTTLPADYSHGASDASAYARARRGLEEAEQAGLGFGNADNMDLGLDFDGEDYPPLPDAEAFSPRQPEDALHSSHQAQHSSILRSSTHEFLAEDEASLYADAPQARKARKAKTIAFDRDLVLARDIIKGWQDNYLANMADAHKASVNGRSQALAKRNAEYWISGRGIGGIGGILGPLGNTGHPLAAFYGQRLLDTLTAGETSIPVHKRVHDQVDPEAPGEIDRRVRQRTVSAEEDNRAADLAPLDANNDGFNLNIDMDEEPEIGRNAPTPLPGELAYDFSSSMPWNISAARTRQPSLMHPGSRVSRGVAGFGGSGMAGISSATPLHAPLSYHVGSHLVSASPLNGRGGRPPLSRQGSLSVQPIDFGAGQGRTSSVTRDFELGFIGDDGFMLPEEEPEKDDARPVTGTQQQREDDRERFGPAANVDTQTAEQSQWVRDVMEHESHNFLEFVQTAMAREESGGPPAEEMTFEALLPPKENSAVVAAQALLHLLSLATRNLLAVRQDEAFGEIRFSMPVEV